MFGSFKSMGAVASLLQNKDKLEAVGARVKARVAELRVEGRAGQGAVRATVSGTMSMLGLHLEPALAAGMSADDRTRELAQGLICEAINDAQRLAQQRVKEIIEQELESEGLGDLARELADRLGNGGLGGGLSGLLS